LTLASSLVGDLVRTKSLTRPTCCYPNVADSGDTVNEVRQIDQSNPEYLNGVVHNLSMRLTRAVDQNIVARRLNGGIFAIRVGRCASVPRNRSRPRRR
jgi:hypothetical protein